ncbi:MAG: YggS family pyridoxal phosphate-dependent enzyme, partial [Bacteroidales bacterium]
MNNIAKQIKKIQNEIPDHVTLVAVTKTKPINLIMEAYQAGIRDFGESKVQELLPKVNELPKDIRWHFIGHLQTNKIKQLLPHVYLIHSIDSIKL